jgi:hypothetical protein
MPYAFQPTVPDLTVVPEPFQGLYSPLEDGSGFKMAPEVFQHLDTSGLNKSIAVERKNNTELKGILTKYKPLGETPEEAHEKYHALEELASKGGKDAQAFEKWKSDIQTKAQQDIQTKDQELKNMMGSLEAHLVDAEAAQAVAALDGSPLLLLPHIRSSVKVVNDSGKYTVRIVDAEGDPRGNGSGGYMTIKDFVSELKSKQDFAGAFKPSGNTGSGMRPGAVGPTNGGMPGGHRIKREDLKDTVKYRAARAAAEKSGNPIEIID